MTATDGCSTPSSTVVAIPMVGGTPVEDGGVLSTGAPHGGERGEEEEVCGTASSGPPCVPFSTAQGRLSAGM